MTLTLLEDGGLIGTARDITDKKKAEAERRELYQQFIHAQKMEAIGRLTGGIAHDFNNMLTIIDGNLQMIGDYKGELPAIAFYVHAAEHAIDRCAALTHRLLAFSRRQVLQPILLNVNDLLHENIKLISRTIGEKVEIVFHPESARNAKLDAAQLENAILNLAINARDVMPGGGTITIATQDVTLTEADTALSLPPGDYVCVSVTDTGTGIEKGMIDRVFEPFFTTKESGKGRGLGLRMF
jgi:signal transduction histidine kinase